MFAKILSSAVVGLDGMLVEVETDILNGLPSFTIVGLPDKAVEESRERVRSAIKNTNGDLPAKRITVNLAPGDLPKEGSSFDLPIAISILVASGQIPTALTDALFLGELSLNGNLRHTKGILPMILLAQEKGIPSVFIPKANEEEAAIIDGIAIYAAESLRDVVMHLLKEKTLVPVVHKAFHTLKAQEYEYDMKDIRGQEFVKRAAEIAVAGGHNLLLKGSPGAGKTLLAKTIPSILPALTFQEALDVTKVYSVAGLLDGRPIVHIRPFRNPHHTTSHIGLIGGSAVPKPGEISLAHRGVLFLDEFPEFPRLVLEAMRQPMEDGYVVISRARNSVTFPSRFMLIAALNPCPCGFYGDAVKECVCTQAQVLKYQKKISGPILDRIDIHIEVPAVKPDKLAETSPSGEDSKTIRTRIEQARSIQHRRFKERTIVTNSEMMTKDVKEMIPLSEEIQQILKQALVRLGLSARSYFKVIKVARTIADIEGLEHVEKSHVLEALQYRPRGPVLA